MATLSFRAIPPSNVLVDNPVMFELFSDTQQLIAFDVYVDGTQAYDGVFMPVGSAPSFEANIAVQDILNPFFAEPAALVTPDAIVSEMERMYVDFTVNFHADDAEILSHTARAYRGGISKELLRRLNEEGLDIFDYKLMNTQQQFFMTTRTNSIRITIREDELTPLCFIATGKTHRVTTDTGETYTFPATEPGKVYAFNIEAFIASLSEPPHQLSIPLFLNQSITIDIIPAARVPNRFALEFTNSYGVPERLEVTGLASYEPEVSDDSYSVYLFNVDDYAERNDRQSLREIIKAQTGYKTPDEYMFLRDLLQSERVYLIDDDGKREVRVKAKDLSHALRPIQPESVELTIRAVDGDARFSPAFYENPVLENLFIATLDIQPNNLTVALPFSGNVNLTVDWGDGTEQVITGHNYPSHFYTAPGVYTINVLGHADSMYIQTSGTIPSGITQWRNSLIAIEKWGDLGFLSLEYACRSCTRLSQTDRKAKFRNVTTSYAMFESCSLLTYTFTQFDAPLLTNAALMYYECNSLQDVSEYLFARCPELQNIRSLFYNCTSLVNIPTFLFANNAKLKDVSSCFSRCIALHNAPSFYYNRNIDSFQYVFGYCYALQVVPDYCFYRSAATDMSYLFNECKSLSVVPAHIFAECTEVLTFKSTFYTCILSEVPPALFRDCGKVTSFDFVFSNCRLTTVPPDLFRYNTQVISFNATFADNSLTAIPADLFRYNTEVLDFSYIFLRCRTLSAIPTDLFRYNIKTTSFRSAFSECYLLTTIPTALFQYNMEATNFYSTFYDCAITAIPPNLFANVKNDASTWVESCFYGTSITSIPENLFASLTQITSLKNTFASCRSLTAIPPNLFASLTQLKSLNRTFSDCQNITAIPPNLFANIKNAADTDLERCFAGTSITSIPENLLAPLTQLTSVSYLFYGCISLTSIPESLFSNCPDLLNFSYAFGCHPSDKGKLASIPNLLFDNNKKLTNIFSCFYGQELLTGTTPSGSDGVKLWERAGKPGYPAKVYGNHSFYKCTGLADYNDIPYDWTTPSY
jgi:hypothetical protein